MPIVPIKEGGGFWAFFGPYSSVLNPGFDFLSLYRHTFLMFTPRKISSAIDKVARQAVGKDWTLFAALLDHWQEIVGTEYARLTTPVKITFPVKPMEARRNGGTLTIRLPKGLAMEFTFKSEQIRERITNYFGYEAISRIMLEPAYNKAPAQEAPAPLADPEALAEIHEAAQEIENDELREALAAFGESVVRSDAQKQ